MLKSIYVGSQIRAAVPIISDDCGIIAECGDLGVIVSKLPNKDVVVKFRKGITFCGRDELNSRSMKKYPVPCLKENFMLC
jgi:hypothetical protein